MELKTQMAPLRAMQQAGPNAELMHNQGYYNPTVVSSRLATGQGCLTFDLGEIIRDRQPGAGYGMALIDAFSNCCTWWLNLAYNTPVCQFGHLQRLVVPQLLQDPLKQFLYMAMSDVAKEMYQEHHQQNQSVDPLHLWERYQAYCLQYQVAGYGMEFTKLCGSSVSYTASLAEQVANELVFLNCFMASYQLQDALAGYQQQPTDPQQLQNFIAATTQQLQLLHKAVTNDNQQH